MARDACCAARRPAARVAVAALPCLAVALLPKCPLCLAAYLSFAGASVGAAAIALTALRCAVVFALGLALAALAIAATRARKGGSAPPAATTR
jgi:hypothetical protein